MSAPYAVASCPVKKCSGRFKITHATTPDGVYDCICHHARLRLEWWDSFLHGPQPRLTVVERGDMP